MTSCVEGEREPRSAAGAIDPCEVVAVVVDCPACVLFISVATQQHRYDSPTPASRLDLLHAIIGDRRLCIDAWITNTTDFALSGGRYYSDKAPGSAALALPAFAIAAGVARLSGVDLNSKTGWLVASWASCAFSQALPAALGAAALFVWLGRFVRQRAVLVTVLALTLGSLPLPYSTLLFSHAQVIGLIGIAVWAMGMFGPDVRCQMPDAGFEIPDAGCRIPDAGGEESEVRSQKSEVGSKNRIVRSLESEVGIGTGRMALAGFCLGLALASEYTAGIVVVALVAYVVVREWRAGRRGGSGVSDFGSGGLQGSTEAQEGEQLEARSWKPEERQGSTGASPYRKRFRPLLWFLLAAVPPLLLIPAY